MELGTSVTSPNGLFKAELWIDGTPAMFHARCPHSRPYVVAGRNQQYAIRVTTQRGRLEVLVSVDGRNVFEPGVANLSTDSGQLVSTGRTAIIDGWRETDERASRLVFSKLPKSIAAQSGDDLSALGVIGLAAFTERPQYTPPVTTFRSHYSALDGGVMKGMATLDEGVKSFNVPERSPGLGTGMGESFDSVVRRVPFTRSDNVPDILAIGYDTAENLARLGILTAPEPNPFPGTVQPPVGYNRADYQKV